MAAPKAEPHVFTDTFKDTKPAKTFITKIEKAQVLHHDITHRDITTSSNIEMEKVKIQSTTSMKNHSQNKRSTTLSAITTELSPKQCCTKKAYTIGSKE